MGSINETETVPAVVENVEDGLLEPLHRRNMFSFKHSSSEVELFDDLRHENKERIKLYKKIKNAHLPIVNGSYLEIKVCELVRHTHNTQVYDTGIEFEPPINHYIRITPHKNLHRHKFMLIDQEPITRKMRLTITLLNMDPGEHQVFINLPSVIAYAMLVPYAAPELVIYDHVVDDPKGSDDDMVIVSSPSQLSITY